MRKIFVFIILGILLIGTMTALTLSNTFTKEITSISSKLMCNKLALSTSIIKSCEKNVSLSDSGIIIKQDPKTLVYEVKAR